MTELLWKIALLAALTHGIRALGRIAGPQRGSLLLGLPSTTAVALVACGQASGIGGASEMAEASLSGLVAAVALPLVFAQSLAQGRQLVWSVAAAVFVYLAVAWGSILVPDSGPAGRIAIATFAVLAACRCADRIAINRNQPTSITPSRLRCLLLRTAVPAACLVAITGLREVTGVRWAGIFSTFPGMTLAVLVVTYLESSPAEAGRMAKSLPSANLGMVAFIGAFRFGCPAVGLGWGTVCGYALATLTLLVVGGLARRPPPTPVDRVRVVRLAGRSQSHSVSLGAALTRTSRRPRCGPLPRGARPGPCRRLSPLVEPIGL
ncbi:hypothetical protein [Singulisphaera acidiphila]|uniref:Uncharacterized protein n=1 Tax=Singulisphaera acidiphila (strain ATCC BAA-1392 / DSM 18658 / VKM B-2454 / MOB10) TaxID=886293 RepID=L0DP62_SINAD|nr:hypothetical protein [Singulisphaera acidiphila]AGA31164.1 hypothetical protein Sinac_7110 [Singulisphaera acidiphila DSM 18658]